MLSFKIYENIEAENDYNPEEDICSGNSQPKSPSISSHHSLRAPSLSGMGRKRSASDFGGGGSLKETKRARGSSSNLSTILKPSNYSILPEALWAEILSLLHPAELGRQRRTCKLFKKSLDDQNTWRRSRKRYLPDYPKPVFGLTEWEMFCVMWGSGCMLCEKGATKTRGNIHSNVKVNATMVYWPFRVRCCKECLEENTTKEFALLSSMSFPTTLLHALPFGIVDLRNNWISNPTHYQPNIGLTKIFWNADIRDIFERYQEAIAMGAQEQWLRGLEGEGVAHKLDVIRIERFERFRIGGDSAGRAWADDIIGNVEVRSQTKQHQYGLLQQEYGGIIKHQRNIKEQGKHWRELSLYQDTSANTTDNTTSISQNISIGSELILQPHNPGGCNKSTEYRELDFAQDPKTVRIRTTLSETAEIQEKSRRDIEARCLQLFPCLKPEVLVRIPAFQAAIKSALPLTEDAWRNLKVKLLEKAPSSEGQGRSGHINLQKLQQQYEERRALEQKQKETKERKEVEWDELQIPVRTKLGSYADEIIKSWAGSVTKDTIPRFAIDVLGYCRCRFYEETPYSADDPHHINPLDTTTRAGKATIEVPTTRRLTLENMKFVFDNKIRPYTDQFGRELFTCNGCEYNPRFYAFEGIIQHYAAKHTSQLSVGPIVVHWRTDWPAKLPFRLNPLAVRVVSYQATTFCPPERNPNIQDQSLPSLEETIAYQFPGFYRSSGQYPSRTTYGFTNYTDCNYLSQHQQVHQRTTQLGSTNQIHPVYLEQIAKDAREAWFQLSGIKDLPSSVRVHYVISKTIASFQAKFSYELPLTVFIEAFKEYTSLKSVKNANGLLCLACHKNPTPAPDGTSRVGRLFTFSALLQHFETMHIVRNRAIDKPDWKTEMVKLPETRLIGMIRQAQGIDKEKQKLLKDVFPLAFSLPLTGGSFNGAINHSTHRLKVEDLTDQLNSSKGIVKSENQATRSSSMYYEKTHPPVTTIKCRIQQDPRVSMNYHHQAYPPTSSPTDYPKPRDSVSEATVTAATGSNIFSRSRYYRSSSRPFEPKLRTDVHQCDKPAMTAAEVFLGNFLHNTEDKLQLEPQKDNDNRLPSFPPYRTSSPKVSNTKDYDEKEKYSVGFGIQDRYRPQITSAKFSKYNNEPKSPPLNQHDRYSAPLSRQSRDPSGQNSSRPCEIVLGNSSHSRYPSVTSHHVSRWSHSLNHSLSGNQHPQQASTHPKDNYGEPLYTMGSNIYYGSKYPPLPRCYRDIGNYNAGPQDSHWSRIPPVVYPFRQLPEALPSGGYYDTKYELDYRGLARSKDPLLSPQLPPAQYSRYLPPRSPVAKIAYMRRSRSPAIVTRNSPEGAMNPYELKSVPLPNHCIATYDDGNNGENVDNGYHQPHGFHAQRAQHLRGPLEGVELQKNKWSNGKSGLYGQERGRGGVGRGFNKATKSRY